MFVLGCSVWLAYAADRWIEGWRLSPGNIRTHRHYFYRARRWPITAFWFAILGLDLSAAFRGLSAAEFRAGGLILLLVVAYLFSHQLLHRNIRWRPPKEVCIAVLLGSGVALFPVCQPGADIPHMAIPLALFASLCFSNCALISVWEKEVDRSHGQISLAIQFPGTIAFSRALPWVLSALSAVAWLTAGPKAGPAAACAAVSGVFLGLVDNAEARIGRILARVLVDLALMTPLVPLLARPVS
jgi:hypothetical protein